MALPTVASLWIGDRLSYIEQLCLKSFVDHGHKVRLYAYGDIAGVPDGVERHEAQAIMPGDAILTHAASGSPAIHADAFRYRLLAREDVVWADTDMLCTAPWEDAGPRLYGWEKTGQSVCNAVLGLPRDSATLARLLELTADPHPVPPWAPPSERARLQAARDAGRPIPVSEMKWGAFGPAALTHFLKETGEIASARPECAFYPVAFRDRRTLLDPTAGIEIGPGTLGVHLWYRRLSRRLVTHEGGVPRPGSFLARALERHGIDPAAAPLPDNPPPGRKAGPKIARAEQTAEAQSRTNRLERLADRNRPRLAPAPPLPARRVLLLSCMKNEGPFILEWIAWNRMIGVSDFLIYTNDCDDPTEALLDALAPAVVTRRANPCGTSGGQRPQHMALRAAVDDPVYARADWVLPIDVDEFLTIHAGRGTLADFLGAAGHPNVASITWRFFGNDGIRDFEDRPVTAQFTRCAPEALVNARLGWGMKTLFHRSAPFTRPGVHRPVGLDKRRADEIRWVNGSGREMPKSYHQRGWYTTERSFGYRLATLNHYSLRSAESFLVKRERGRINHTEQDQGAEYWARRDFGTETDLRAAERVPELFEEIGRLRALPGVAELHEAAVAWHRERAKALRSDPDYGALFERITAPGRTDAAFLPRRGKPPRARPVTRAGRTVPAPPATVGHPPAFADLAATARARRFPLVRPGKRRRLHSRRRPPCREFRRPPRPARDRRAMASRSRYSHGSRLFGAGRHGDRAELASAPVRRGLADAAGRGGFFSDRITNPVSRRNDGGGSPRSPMRPRSPARASSRLPRNRRWTAGWSPPKTVGAGVPASTGTAPSQTQPACRQSIPPQCSPTRAIPPNAPRSRAFRPM